MLKGFYEGLYGCLNQRYYLPNLKTTIIQYQKMLSLGLKLSGIQFSVALTESIEDLRRTIERCISSTGKKIIVLIDDIDRLHDKTEIFEIFKIVKLSARLSNTIFLLSFDLNLVSSYLKEDVAVDASFIEKIVQRPIYCQQSSRR